MNAFFAFASGTRSCGRRGPASDGSTSERSSSTTCEYVRMVLGVVPEHVLLAVRLHERDPFVRATREPQVLQRHVVDREEAARRAVLGAHVPERRAVCERERRHAFAEVLDELPDDADLAEDLRHREHEVGRGRALRQGAGELHADDLRHEHRKGLAEHRGLGFDAADAPAEHAEPVDHRRVRVGADEGVREGDTVARLDDACEELEVDLMADARVRRDGCEVVERALAPAQERVALAVPLELELDVALQGEPRRELVHLHRVVDHELDRDQRVDAARVAALLVHRVAHRGEVDDAGDAREVLEEHPGGRERDLARRLLGRDPAGDRLDLRLGAVAQDVLQQDPQRVGQPRDIPARLERVEPVDRVAQVADSELLRLGHAPIQAELLPLAPRLAWEKRPTA